MKIELIKGDITKVATEAIVNAANSSLLGGGGVDGAIHRAGGPTILAACKEIRAAQGECSTGEAVITPAGELPAHYVIHTVGPVWEGGTSGESELLRNCYQNSLDLADRHELKSIAFPNVSTGVYHFPKQKAAQIALETAQQYEAEHLSQLLFVCFDDENYQIYQKLLNEKPV